MVRRFLEQGLPLYSRLCGMILLGALFIVISYLLLHGLRTINLSLVFGTTPPLDALLMKRHVFDGLFPAVAGTFLLVILSVGWAIPVGVAAGIYMAEYAGAGSKAVLNVFFDIMAGLPSIVIGLFGFAVAVFLNKNFSDRIHPCLLISSLALGVLVLPYLIRTTQIALESLPTVTRMTALSLGASPLQNIVHVMLPQALPGFFSGIILSIGRCAEDTAVIMLTGAVASAGVPRSLLSHYEALPFYIYYISSQYADQRELATGYGAALILLVVCLALFALSFVIRQRVAWRAFIGV